MIRKIKENFMLLLVSNITTAILIAVAPRINGAIANLVANDSDNHFAFSLLMPLCYIICALIVSMFICLRKPQAVRDIVINNSISAGEDATSNIQNAEEMRERHRTKLQCLETAKYSVVKDYTYFVLSPYMTDDDIEMLCQNIKLYDIPESIICSVKTNGSLNTLDIRHYAWNIGERLGWSGQKRATFIKLCFPVELQGVEVESIRRTLRQKGKCVIEIDIPEHDDYQFHFPN